MKNLLTLIILSLLISCGRVATAIVTKKDVSKDVKVFKNDKTGQIILFIGMVHLGEEGYYESAKRVITKARENGFKILYEGVDGNIIQDEQERFIYWAKFRKIVGVYPRYSKENNSLPKYFKKYYYQSLTDYGLKKDVDINFDLNLKELIDGYEERFGKIELTECDLKTPLMSKYKCSKINNNASFAMLHIVRDDVLIDRLKKMEFDKIAIVFGKGHYIFMYPEFIKMGFRELSKKEAEKFK